MTRTLLHIDASARSDSSASRALSARIADRISAGQIVRRDLADPLPQITENWVSGNFTPPADRSAEQQETLALSDMLVGELQAADTIVLGTPIYNFSIPASLKAWIDLVCRAGMTFEYTPEGPRGLLSGKRVVVAITSGGTAVGSDIDFASGYLRHIFGFIGIDNVEIIAADRLMAQQDAALAAANDQIADLAA